MKYAKPYLLFHALVWLPWGLVCVFDLEPLSAIVGVAAEGANARSDLRAMYGGLEMAIGLMAVSALFRPRLFPHVVFALAYLGCGLTLGRGYGLYADESGSIYTWGVIAYEAFAGLSAIAWLVALPRLQPAEAETLT